MTFTPEQQKALRALCPARSHAFVTACARIRQQFERDSQRNLQPAAMRKRWEHMRRSYQSKRQAAAVRPAELTSFDVAALALADPTIRLTRERHSSAQPADSVAAAFGKLERMERPTRYPNLAEHAAARRVRDMFERFGLPFTDYQSDHGQRGAAVVALAIIIGATGRRNVRHLIRYARSLERAGETNSR